MKLNYTNINNYEESIEEIANLLEVWNNDRYIIICPIDKVFNNTNNIKDINNWNDTRKIINENKSNSYKNNKIEIINSWNFILNYFKDKEVKDLAVVEVDYQDNYLVRGIISKDDKIKIAINPTYNDIRPKSIIEKYNLAFSDEVTYINELINEYGEKKLIK